MKHRAMLTDYAAKVVGDRALAEDIVQEAWLSLTARRGGADVRDPVSYLRTMVRNLAIDMLRRKALESRLCGGDMDTAIRTVADNHGSPENALASRRDLACVLGVLRTLPERQRVAIEMYRFGDYKLREIADHLGVSVPLVHLLISEGLASCADRCGLDGFDL
ncbi:MAG: sigma-70 family RNA polymerase sigma factor [Sphingobium sp.]